MPALPGSHDDVARRHHPAQVAVAVGDEDVVGLAVEQGDHGLEDGVVGGHVDGVAVDHLRDGGVQRVGARPRRARGPSGR